MRTMGLREEDLLDIHGNAFIRSHELAARQLGNKRWGDKNPENLLYLNLWFKLLKGKMFFTLFALFKFIGEKFEERGFILHRCGSIIGRMGYREILFAHEKTEAKKNA